MKIFNMFTVLTAVAAFLFLSAFGLGARPVALAEEPRLIAVSAETITVQSAERDGESFSVSIPKNCEYEPLNCLPSDDGRCGVLLSVPGGESIELVRWDNFGMCGTGVSFEYVETEGGEVTVATETLGGSVWLTMIRNIDDRTYVLMGQLGEESYTALKAPLLSIMASIEEN